MYPKKNFYYIYSQTSVGYRHFKVKCKNTSACENDQQQVTPDPGFRLEWLLPGHTMVVIQFILYVEGPLCISLPSEAMYNGQVSGQRMDRLYSAAGQREREKDVSCGGPWLIYF